MRAQGTADKEAGAGRLAAAAAWLTRLDESEDMSAAELKEWQQFIASSENREAFDAVRRVASAVPRLDHPPLPSAAELDEDRYDGTVPIRRWKLEQEIKTYSGAEARQRGRWLIGAAALAGALLLSLGIWLAPDFSSSRQMFETGAGEHRLATLPDGSKVLLGARTRVDVQYNASRRLIRLARGEALFTVTHNRKRPFVVVAGTRAVTAVGTEFDVWRDLDRTTVTVTAGAVEVNPINQGRRVAVGVGAARVNRGQKLTYAENGLSGLVEAADLAAATGWREGRLVYRHMPLKYVISDVNRYFQQQFEIGDLAVGELQFSGAVLATQSASEFLRALENIFPVEAERVDRNRILIRSRAPVVTQQAAARP